jgi:hypothetical protein
MLLTVLRWCVRGSPGVLTTRASNVLSKLPTPLTLTSHHNTNISRILSHSYQQNQAEARRALPRRTTPYNDQATTTTPSKPPAKKPCRSKTASKPSSAGHWPKHALRSAASSPPGPLETKETPPLLLLLPLPLSRRHQKSRSTYQLPWHQLHQPGTAGTCRSCSTSRPTSRTKRTPGSGTTGIPGRRRIRVPLRERRSCRVPGARRGGRGSGMSLALMIAPSRRFWREGRARVATASERESS